MARKIGQIVRRGSSTWLVRIYVGRNPETRKRRYIGKFIHGGLRSANRKLSARTIRYAHSVLFSALRQAVRWKLLLTNPAEEVYLPRHSRRRFTVFDVEQARQFIAAISGHRYEVLFALAMTTGMRPSEYLALTWSDFDLERGAVSVSKTLHRRYEDGSSKIRNGKAVVAQSNCKIG